MKNNNPKIIQERFFAELDDNTKWTRARVEEKIGLATIIALRMNKTDKIWQDKLASWPADCSVRYEWFESVIADIKLKPNMDTLDKSFDTLYTVLVHWLDSVDSVTDRKLLILHACDISMNKIGAKLGLLRQTASRRHTKALEMLVWHLNHPKDDL